LCLFCCFNSKCSWKCIRIALSSHIPVGSLKMFLTNLLTKTV
jgi:hypothetical protein